MTTEVSGRTAVPESASLALLGFGVLALGFVKNKQHG
jgi:hypothetical protein